MDRGHANAQAMWRPPSFVPATIVPCSELSCRCWRSPAATWQHQSRTLRVRCPRGGVRRIVECTLHATTCDSCAAARGAKPSSSCWLPRTHRCAAGVRGWCSVAMARQCVDRGAGAGAPPEATTTRWRTPAVRGLFRRWKCTEGGACRDSHSHAAAAAATAAAAAALGLRRPLLVRRSLALPCPALAPVAAVAPGSSLPSLPEVPSEVSPCSKVHRGHRHAVAVLTL